MTMFTKLDATKTIQEKDGFKKSALAQRECSDNMPAGANIRY